MVPIVFVSNAYSNSNIVIKTGNESVFIFNEWLFCYLVCATFYIGVYLAWITIIMLHDILLRFIPLQASYLFLNCLKVSYCLPFSSLVTVSLLKSFVDSVFTLSIIPVAMENEELALNSYYASSQNVTNNNSNFYRPYDTAIGYNNNDESWSFFNANGVLNASSSVNRNMYINNNPTPDFDTPPVWPQFVEPTYPQYSHFSNVNFWPQLYIPQVASYESHHHDYMRHPFSVDQGVDNINESGYELDAGRLPVDTVPSASTLIAQPSLYPNEISNYPVQQQSQQSQSFPSTSNNVDNVPQLPIRPIPQQAVKNADPAHQCKDCSRSCVSAGGLKRHAKFCRASPANLQTIFASLNRPTEEKDSAPVVVDNSTSSNQYPVNLSCMVCSCNI